MSEENWFDIDGDGVVENDEIDKIPLFHKATHRVQSLLREYHLQHGSNSVLYSLTKCDFTSLIKMPEEEQVNKANDYVESGTKALASANKSQKSKRKYMCCCLIIGLGILLAFLLPFIFSTMSTTT